MKIELGLKVFLRPTGNIARYDKNIKTGEITKIGRKYFYVGVEKFELETLRNINMDCNSAWVLYFSEQEILDEKEKNELSEKFHKLFHWTGNYNKLTLEQLKEMASIANLK